jgi:hypothetical protein
MAPSLPEEVYEAAGVYTERLNEIAKKHSRCVHFFNMPLPRLGPHIITHNIALQHPCGHLVALGVLRR